MPPGRKAQVGRGGGGDIGPSDGGAAISVGAVVMATTPSARRGDPSAAAPVPEEAGRTASVVGVSRPAGAVTSESAGRSAGDAADGRVGGAGGRATTPRTCSASEPVDPAAGGAGGAGPSRGDVISATADSTA